MNVKSKPATLPVVETPDIRMVTQKYAVSITNHIEKNLHKSSIAAQYLPTVNELVITPDEMADPIGDDAHSPVTGIVHRYPDRVLLKPVNVCAVYCRYCFRREKIGPGKSVLKPDELQTALNYIRENENIWEVILTGGDPLVLSPAKLQSLLDQIEAIDHVKIIRIHTRVPIADPERITDDMLRALTRTKALYIAVHVNHVDELTPEVKTTLTALRKADCILLSQSVLLKGINDNAKTLEDLFRALVEIRVKPYYLHHMDKAPGTSHFRTTISHGKKIMKQLRGKISGLCQPHYMLDIPGGHGKVPITDNRLEQSATHTYNVEDIQSKIHAYND